MTEITGELYREFINYFSNNFPGLRAKFPKEIEWTLLKPPYGVVKPIDMSIEDYDDLREIELRWRIENAILREDENEPMFILVASGSTQVNPKNVISVTTITNKSTEIKGAYNNGVDFSFNVVGTIDFVNKKLGIGYE